MATAAELLRVAAGFHRAGALDDAERLYARILEAAPEDSPTLRLAALAAHQNGRPADAAVLAGRFLAREPRHADIQTLLGVTRQAAGAVGPACVAYRRCLSLDPLNAGARANLGAAWRALGDADRAAAYQREAAAIDPRRAEAHYEAAKIDAPRGRVMEAARALRRVLALVPDHAPALAELGLVYRSHWRMVPAERALRRALMLAPTLATAHNELATLLTLTERFDAAETRFLKALALQPADDRIRFNMALPYWQRGRLAEGYRLYDRGLTNVRRPARDYAIPRWRGEPLAGRRIVVQPEQGLGDEIRFASCYADLIAAAGPGGHCILQAEPRLVPVMQRSFPQASVRPFDRAAVPPPPRDAGFWVMAGSLPRHFRPDRAAFPRRSGYLTPDPARVAAWRERLAALPPGPKVGIAWRSRRMAIRNLAYYTTIEMWREVLAVPGVVFVNLQYDCAPFELETARERLGAEIHHWPDADLMNDLETAFALAAAVDLGITVATSVHDQLGAVGTEGWVLWPGTVGRWGGTDYPFYPAISLVTRSHTESAAAALSRAARRLERWRAGRGEG